MTAFRTAGNLWSYQAFNMCYSSSRTTMLLGNIYKIFSFPLKTFAIMRFGLPRWLDGKESACNEGSIPGSGRSPRRGNGLILAWKIPWTEELGRLQSTGV